MSDIKRAPAKGAKEARRTLPALLDLAERGEATIISRHRRPVAAIVPIACHEATQERQPGQRSLLSLSGSGSGLWEKHSARMIRKIRNEWTR